LFGVDAVHGHSNVFGTTIFPHNIGLGATRNSDLIEEIGRVTAAEVYATGIRWNFAPCLCVARDERWGRTYESFGETPELVAMMTSYIDGLQGETLSSRNSVLATAKHWVGDGGTTRGIDQGNTQVSENELFDVHVAPFVDAISREVGSVMPSYSSWNGQKLHGDEYLLTTVLRDELGFEGFVISDWAAIDQLPGDYASDVRTSINAGIDMVMVPDEYEFFIDTLRAEVESGNVTIERIDEAVSRILQAKFDLGLFDQPFSDRTGLDDIGSDAHRQVARQAVQESLVLLKNDGVLPISREVKEIVVAGPSADNIGFQSGGWTISWQGGSGPTTIGTTVLEGIEQVVSEGTTVTYDRRGNGALTGDIGIIVVGEQPYAEGRGDSLDISLRSSEEEIVKRVCEAMPCVVVMVSGRPLVISELIDTMDAFVAAWLPGSEGAGIADVLFGHVDFTGKLPMTWPRSVEQLPINVEDSDYDPLFPYGYGLQMFE
jgi:beta-glucosidase